MSPGRGHPLARVLVVAGIDLVLANLGSVALVALYGAFRDENVQALLDRFAGNGNVLTLLSAGIAPLSWALLWWARRALDRRSFPSLGLSRMRRRNFAGGVAVGLAGAACVAGVGVGAGVYDVTMAGPESAARGIASGSALLAVLALGFLLQGATEELLVRGYVQRNLYEWEALQTQPRRRAVWVIAFPSFLFAGMHVLNPDFGWVPMLNTFLIGVLLALWVLRDGHLGSVMGFHASWNFGLAAVFGLPLSGMQTISVCEVSVGGGAHPRWLALLGGDYGPEGGWLLTAVTLVSIAGLGWRWRHALRHAFAPPSGPPPPVEVSAT